MAPAKNRNSGESERRWNIQQTGNRSSNSGFAALHRQNRLLLKPACEQQLGRGGGLSCIQSLLGQEERFTARPEGLPVLCQSTATSCRRESSGSVVFIVISRRCCQSTGTEETFRPLRSGQTK